MVEPTREAKLTAGFVSLADTLVANFDVIDLLHTLVETSVDVFDVDAGGLLLRSAAGKLEVIASTSDSAAFVEVVELGAQSGPCWECAATGRPNTTADLSSRTDRWPEFVRAAARSGYRSVHATPLRLRGSVIGALNLFGTAAGELDARDVAAAQALADVATISVLAERAAREQEAVTAQLQGALDSRVVIEQAKGVLAEALEVPVDRAFALLRAFARGHNLSLSAVAAALRERRLAPARLLPAEPGSRPAPSGHGGTGLR